MITLNKIVDGISEALNAEFGDTYEIYTEDVEQGLTEPCFSIVLLRPSITQFLGRRYFRTNLFCIHYFPKAKDNPKIECFEAEERLMNALEYITVDNDKIRGTNMHGEISDNVLAFMVNFDMFITKEQAELYYMESLKQSSNVKKDGE